MERLKNNFAIDSSLPRRRGVEDEVILEPFL
jgi:hypothetical protein